MIDTLYQYAENKQIEIAKCKLPTSKLKGLYCDNVIYIDESVKLEKERNCIIAEELGHYETSQGNILNYKDSNNQKQEVTARNWAAERIVTVKSLINAFNIGIRNKFELSEYLDITEEFIDYSITRLSQKHGEFAAVDDYIVYFTPNLMIFRANEK